MEINLAPQIEFTGRSGLSRTLGARFTETPFLFTFISLSMVSGLFVLMDVFFPLLHLEFKTLLTLSAWFKLAAFIVTAYIAWVLHNTSKVRVHLHGERLIYELKDKGALTFNFWEVQSIRTGHSQGVLGIFMNLKSGVSIHFPMHLERLDYILDSLHFYRSELTQTDEFMIFRTRALALDHMLAHNRHYLSRAHIKAVSFYFLYPLYFRHDLRRLRADPRKVSRDLSYEKKMESLCHKVNISFGLATLTLGTMAMFLN